MGEIVNNIALLIILTLGSTTFATRQCVAGPQFCTRNGINYQPGDSVPSLDSCNTCWCDGNVSPPTIACTEMYCTSESAQESSGSPEPQFCTRNGINYQPGDSVPSLDSCNTCWCNGNVIVCTKIGCPS